MGNNDPREVRYEDSQQVQLHSNGRPRIGLTPSEGHDAYKRSSTRSSRRSRLERTSYLMATGHLNPEETQHLTRISPSSEYIANKQQDSNDSSDRYGPFINQGQGFSGNQAFNDYVSSSFNENIFAPTNLKSNSGRTRGMSNSNSNRGNFKQKFVVPEVPMPMKTSPAFEYILKCEERRNRRCCLWLLYLILITICIAIIVFLSVLLAIRYQSS